MSVYFGDVLMALHMSAHLWNNGTSACRLILLMSQPQYQKEMPPVNWRYVGVSVDFVHDLLKFAWMLIHEITAYRYVGWFWVCRTLTITTTNSCQSSSGMSVCRYISHDFSDLSKVCINAYSWNNGISVCRLISVMSHLQQKKQVLRV